MATYYVEVYRPAYPNRGVKIAVHKEKDYSPDVLNPTCRAVFRVRYVRNRQEAIAVALEKLAGYGTDVNLVLVCNQLTPAGRPAPT